MARQIHGRSPNAVTSRISCKPCPASGRALCAIAQVTVRFRADEVESAQCPPGYGDERRDQITARGPRIVFGVSDASGQAGWFVQWHRLTGT
jgi:hypothetical protein